MTPKPTIGVPVFIDEDGNVTDVQLNDALEYITGLGGCKPNGVALLTEDLIKLLEDHEGAWTMTAPEFLKSKGIA